MPRPIERIAEDLRVLGAALRDPPEDVTRWQRASTVLAWDAALGEACAALGVGESLASERRRGRGAVERRRVEAALRRAGLDLPEPRP